MKHLNLRGHGPVAARRRVLGLAVLAAASLCLAACSQTGAQGAGAGTQGAGAGTQGAEAGTAAPSATASASTTSGQTEIGGNAYFLAGAMSPVRIMALHQGAVTVAATLPADPTPCTHNTVSVSPDGQHLAWIAGGTSHDQGTLMLAGIDGTHAIKITTQVSCLGPTAIVWAGQGVVEAFTLQGGKRDFHVSNGRPVGGDPGDETEDVWSVDGAAVAARGEDMSLYAATVNGGNFHKITYSPPADQAAHWDGFAPRSVTSDAGYVAVGWKGTDPSRRDDSFAILTAGTSRPVQLPESAIVHAEFLANHTTLIESAGNAPTLDILDAGWHVTASVPLPAAVAHLPLIRFVP